MLSLTRSRRSSKVNGGRTRSAEIDMMLCLFFSDKGPVLLHSVHDCCPVKFVEKEPRPLSAFYLLLFNLSWRRRRKRRRKRRRREHYPESQERLSPCSPTMSQMCLCAKHFLQIPTSGLDMNPGLNPYRSSQRQPKFKAVSMVPAAAET